MKFNTRIVDPRRSDYDVFIGRPAVTVGMHFAPPFTHTNSKYDLIKVDSAAELHRLYERWLLGQEYIHIEPARRSWIANRLRVLPNLRMGCFCTDAGCYGNVLIRLAEDTWICKCPVRLVESERSMKLVRKRAGQPDCRICGTFGTVFQDPPYLPGPEELCPEQAFIGSIDRSAMLRDKVGRPTKTQMQPALQMI